ncbi:MAG: restriction endonuclease [Acidobacteria bacterium]|nr:restriction endonuclease [Acidobacteriota bacterium]
MIEKQDLPSTQELMWPTLEALRALGGSGRIEEINGEVIKRQGFSEEQLAIRRPKKERQSMIEYRLAWSRTKLKEIGAIKNSAWGVWALTDDARNWSEVDLDEHRQSRSGGYLSLQQNRNILTNASGIDDGQIEGDDGRTDWKERLLERLLEMPPDAFERLAQRLLREAGFRNVEVTGRPGDGGIDGVGVFQLSLVPFHIFFQCKRYRGTVPPSEVRDFRGAMSGRGEKGLLITTGSFTKSARDEATRDGAPPVELVDADALCELLKQYSLGVRTETRTIEDVLIVDDFFDKL